MPLVKFEELAEWSGLERPSAVRRWLQERGIPIITRRDGRPVTTEAAIDAAILRGSNLATAPDWTALDESPPLRSDQSRARLLR